ncbi:SDR family oxidoreductase [Sphingomonas sp. MG17]|uniref:SDR family oxidoreductase n=2 Tax=Sphingomonas tagetis TaxID=2949092 RepID=A0A9X2KQT4_9SPHN|nr:SDR family oxidoreductase [Sphingomonas tagetis]
MTAKMHIPDFRSMLDLHGRRFVVLGAGEGIGIQVSHALAQCGARLLCVDIDGDRAKRIAEEIGGTAFVADVTDPVQVEAAFTEAARRLGGVDGLVDVIGMARIKPIVDMSPQDISWQLDIVYRHALYAIAAGAKAMVDGGTMAFVSSLAGERYVENQVLYGSAKAALNQLVRGAAAELGARGIRINAVAPGFIRTPRMLDLLGDGGWQALDGASPSGRSADPSEIASALLFLSSGLASHVTGVILPADGGMVVKSALPPLSFGAASRGE